MHLNQVLVLLSKAGNIKHLLPPTGFLNLKPASLLSTKGAIFVFA